MGRGGLAEHLHVSEDYLRAHGVELFWVERGGMATFHGPGQLVAYPIIRLRAKDLRWYMETLCGAVAQVLRDYGLTPELGVHGPGVWVNGGKIASVGMSVRRWVTFHGMALNVTTDLNYFRLITPCGNPTERMTSMQEELGRPVDLDEVAERFAAAFAQAFDFAIRPEPPARRPSWLTVRLRPGRRGAPGGRTGARPGPAHGLPGGPLSQPGRMLQPGHGHLHHHGRRLHARLPLLRRGQGTSRAPGPGGAGACGPRRAAPWACAMRSSPP